MYTLELTESTSITTTRERTREGYLKVVANITKAGVSVYPKEALDSLHAQRDANLPDKVGLLRPLSILENPTTQESVRLKPVTYKHPAGQVNQDNYTRHACGHVGGVSVTHDGHLQAEMLIHDKDLIQKIEDGEMEVSIGTYPTKIVRENGTFDGRPYHFKVENPLDINHVAVVERGKGRAGRTVRILESTDEDTRMDKKDLDEIKNAIAEGFASAKGSDEKKGGIDEAKLTAALTESIGSIITKKDEERAEAEKKAKEDAEKTEQALKESTEAVNDRADILVQAQKVMTQEAYDKVKNEPIKVILTEALGDSVEGTDKMDEPELRGAFKVAIKQRLSESITGPRVTGLPPASTGAGPKISSGLDYNRFRNMSKGRGNAALTS